MHLTIKYGLITLIKTTENLCKQLANVDQDCPVEKGELKVTKEVDLPSQIPPVSRSPCTSLFAELIWV